MPIGFEVNDFDSDEDVSSTEDDGLKVPVVNKKNKKLKSKVKTQKNSILKESKIVKDKAKKTIKNMESEINDLEYFEYLKDKTENEGEKEISKFFTDDELVDQFKELERLQKIQKQMWKVNNSHIALTEMEKNANVIQSGMGRLFRNNSKNNNNSRTQQLNTTSRINTRIPILGGSRIINKNYNNIGKMW